MEVPTACLSGSPIIKFPSVDKESVSNNKFKSIYLNCFFIGTLEKLRMIQAYEEPLAITKNLTLNSILVPS